MTTGGQRVDWVPTVEYAGILLTIVGPNDFQFGKSFEPGTTPAFELSASQPDGSYTYELRVTAPGPKKTRNANEQTVATSPATPARALVQSGFFTVLNGAAVPPDIPEPAPQTPPGTTTPTVTTQRIGSIGIMDVLHLDDVIVTGGLCAGFGCLTDGTEDFNFKTIKLKEDNDRLYFDDTSTTAGFPRNDWQIVINDTTSGGGNYFAVGDITGGKTPFRIEAGARTNALSSTAAVGRIGTARRSSTCTCSLETRLNSPRPGRLRGWTAKSGHRRKRSASSSARPAVKLPFRISRHPDDTLTLKSDGKVGIGTWSPAYMVEVDTTGANSAIVTKRTDEPQFHERHRVRAQFGAVTNHRCILVDSTWRMMINSDGSLNMSMGRR
jgi:hypothetical protein